MTLERAKTKDQLYHSEHLISQRQPRGLFSECIKAFLITTKTTAILIIVVVLSSCTLSSDKIEFEKAQKDVQNRYFDSALKHLKVVMDHQIDSELAIEAAKESARISHYESKDFRSAVAFYKDIVLYSKNPQDRIYSQRQIADIYFNNLQDYTQSVVEYQRLLELPHSLEDELTYRLSIARSNFYLTNFYQAEVDIDELLKRPFSKEVLFEAYLLRANLYLTGKQLDGAIAVLKKLIENYPERSKKESIGLVLAICYEEQKNFAKAIETLQAVRVYYPRKEFVDRRIKSLRERQSYLPGARGLKK
jgi:tetratricopeptide (TPR) repeat protein